MHTYTYTWRNYTHTQRWKVFAARVSMNGQRVVPGGMPAKGWERRRQPSATWAKHRGPLAKGGHRSSRQRAAEKTHGPASLAAREPRPWRDPRASRCSGMLPGTRGALPSLCHLSSTAWGGHRAGQRRARTREQLRASQAPGGSPTASQGVHRGPRAHRTRRQNEWVTTPLGGAAGTFARTGVTKEHTWAPHGLDESDQLCGDLAPSPSRS